VWDESSRPRIFFHWLPKISRKLPNSRPVDEAVQQRLPLLGPNADVFGGEMLKINLAFPGKMSVYDFMGGSIRKYLAQDSHIARNRRKKGNLGQSFFPMLFIRGNVALRQRDFLLYRLPLPRCPQY